MSTMAISFSGWFARLSYPEPGLREDQRDGSARRTDGECRRSGRGPDGGAGLQTTRLGGAGKNALVRAM